MFLKCGRIGKTTLFSLLLHLLVSPNCVLWWWWLLLFFAWNSYLSCNVIFSLSVTWMDRGGRQSADEKHGQVPRGNSRSMGEDCSRIGSIGDRCEFAEICIVLRVTKLRAGPGSVKGGQWMEPDNVFLFKGCDPFIGPGSEPLTK